MNMDQATGTNDTPEKQRAFSEILEHKMSILDRTNTIEARLGHIVERLYGPYPTEGPTAEKESEPSCMVDNFRAINDRTMSALTGVENLLTRIEGAV